MLRFGLVCIAGFVGGAICGTLILLLGNAEFLAIQPFQTLGESLMIGCWFGGLFGIISFPVCYYLFLRNVSVSLILAVTLLATVFAGWLGTDLLLRSRSNQIDVVWSVGQLFAYYFGPALVGLLLSSIALNRFAPKVVEHG